MAHHIWRRRRWYVAGTGAVAVIAIAAVVLLSRGSSAPSASELPVAAGLRVGLQFVSGSLVQSDLDVGRLQNEIVFASPGRTLQSMIFSELILLLRRGWRWRGQEPSVRAVAAAFPQDDGTLLQLRSPDGRVELDISPSTDEDVTDLAGNLAIMPATAMPVRPSFWATLSYV